MNAMSCQQSLTIFIVRKYYELSLANAKWRFGIS